MVCMKLIYGAAGKYPQNWYVYLWRIHNTYYFIWLFSENKSFGSDGTSDRAGFDVFLNVNQDSKKQKHFYADPGNDLFGFQVGTIMRLNKNDVINLENVDSEAFQVAQSFEISLVLTRLA